MGMVVVATLSVYLFAGAGTISGPSGGLSPVSQLAVAQSKRRTRKRTTTKSQSKLKVDPTALPMVGTWYTLGSDGKPVKANRFVFANTGGFRYVGPGWSSEGTFKLQSLSLMLTWTKIDGKPVKANSVKKTLPMAEDRKSFQLDRFRYGKS